MRVLCAVLAGLLLGPAAARAEQSPGVFPLSQVKKGQRGYGLTVFEGTEPERFEFEVVGVAKNFLPKMDIILVRSDDPKIEKSGFAQGMSGSPLYIDGKVACAFSYGFPFARSQIGGCTPIEYMLADARRPVRGPLSQAVPTKADWQRRDPLAGLAKQPGDDLASLGPWLRSNPLPTRPGPVHSGQMQRAMLPLSVSGLGTRAFEAARELFEPLRHRAHARRRRLGRSVARAPGVRARRSGGRHPGPR